MIINNYQISRGLPTTNEKIGNVNLPDFNESMWLTKGTAAMSDDKYKEAIVQQAIKDAKNNTFQSSTEFKKLKRSFISVVSPDRKMIIKKGLKEIFNNKTKQLDMIDIILGNGKTLGNKKILKNAIFKDDQGNEIAKFSNGKWTMYETKEETAREKEMLGLYNDAWRQAKNNKSFDDENSLIASVNENTFTAKA